VHAHTGKERAPGAKFEIVQLLGVWFFGLNGLKKKEALPTRGAGGSGRKSGFGTCALTCPDGALSRGAGGARGGAKFETGSIMGLWFLD